MVEICIFLEGGVVPHPNDSAETVDNSQRFRESFSKLFSSAFDDKVKIIIDPRGGFTRASRDFERAENNPLPLLLIDLDGPENNRTSKLDVLCTDFNLTSRKNDIYFMVQKMEAWILSQPEKVETFFYDFKQTNTPISEDSSILKIVPQTIIHPDSVLNTLLGRHFQKNKNGKLKRLKYGKLKDAPNLIELLDFQQLRRDFGDVENIYLRISSLI